MITNSDPQTTVTRIELGETPDFELGGVQVSPARRLVFRESARHELEPKVAQVLVALAAARPDVVSRDRLIEQCWEGRIVGDDALNRCIVALRHLARDFSPEPFMIETVARVGYCLIERPADDAEPALGAPHSKAKMWVAGVLALTALTAAISFGWSRLGTGDSKPASIAVLPFRNLSDGSPYFAQGVGEEVLDQLAREPQFRVTGSASTSQVAKESDIRKVGKQLDVDYVVEGSVRTQGDRVRVNVHLTDASDGRRMWAESYDGKLDDILAIQSRIGGSIASALSRKLVNVRSGPPRAINGEAYALYLNARGLVRAGNPQSAPDAINLLQESIRLDPQFAPAWSNLASALTLNGRTKGSDGLIAALPQAQAAARHALQLDPNLAEAHGVLGTLIDADTPEGLAHMKRAAELDPRTGQGQIWSGAAHYIAGEYPEGTAAYRRAHDLDPLWPDPVKVLVDIYSAMGDRQAAEAVVRKGIHNDPMLQQFALARVAWLTGDFSEAARLWSIVAKDSSSRWASPAKLSLEDTLYLLKLSPNLPSRPARPTVGQNRFGPRVWMPAPPSPTEWQYRNRSLAAALVYHDQNVVAAKRMLLAGRAQELAATYYGPTGLLYMRPGVRMGVCDLHEAALVALALRNAGHRAEADALLREADALLQTAYHRGQVPTWFDEDAAAIWALQGKAGPAVEALARALRRGAAHVGRSDLPDMADEPTFRSLRGDPRFQKVLSAYRARFARERDETARALKTSAS